MEGSKSGAIELQNAREIDIRRQIEYLRYLTQNISAGLDIQRHSKIIISYFTGGFHRLVRLLSYNLIKELPDIDYSSIIGTISTDLASIDPEIQLNAVKLLYSLPIKHQIEILKVNEKDLQKMLIKPEFHYERLICLNDFLMKSLIKSYSLLDTFDGGNIHETIYDLYMKMAELIFHSSRDISRNAFEVFRSIYQNYIISMASNMTSRSNIYLDGSLGLNLYSVNGNSGDYDIQKSDKYFDGNGSIILLIRPLMIKLTNYLLPKITSILQIVQNFELRHKTIFLSVVTNLLSVGMTLYSDITQFKNLDILMITGYKDLNFIIDDNSNNNNIKNNISNISNNNNNNNGPPLSSESLKLLVKDIFYDNLIKDLKIDTCEFDLIMPTMHNLFIMLNITYQKQWSWILPDHEKSELLKTALIYFFNIMKKVSYKREFVNQIILNFASLSRYLNDSYKLLFSLKIIEIASMYIQNQLDKFLLYFISWTNILYISINLVNNDQPSAIFSLFQQTWFIQKLNDKDDDTVPKFKEELLVTLIMSCFYIKSQIRNIYNDNHNKHRNNDPNDKINTKGRQIFTKILHEVLDLSSRLIDWKMETQSEDDDTKLSYLSAVNMYLLLLEDSYSISINKEELSIHINEIIKRIIGKQISFDLKLKVLLTLTKNNNNEIIQTLPINDLLEEFKSLLLNQNSAALLDERLIQKLPNPKRLIMIISQIEAMLQILFNINMIVIQKAANLSVPSSKPNEEHNFQDFTLKLMNLYSDYMDHLSRINELPTVLHPLVMSIIEFNESMTKLLLNCAVDAKNYTNNNIAQIHIATNFLDQIEFAQDEEPEYLPNYTSFDYLTFAYNIYYMKLQSPILPIPQNLLNIFKNSSQQQKSYIKSPLNSSITEVESNRIYLTFNMISNNYDVFHQDLFDNGKLIENLIFYAEHHVIQCQNDMNYRIKSPILISGIADCLQIYASHAVLPSQKLISVNLKLTNITKFLIDNIKLQPLYSDNLEIYPRLTNPYTQQIESISQTTFKQVNFTFFVNDIKETRIIFEVNIDNSEFDNPVCIKTIAYKINFLDFVIPNFMGSLNELTFEEIWKHMPYYLIINCKIKQEIDHEKFLDIMKKTKFCVTYSVDFQVNNQINQIESNSEQSGGGSKSLNTGIINIPNTKWNQISMLGYVWDENTVGIVITENKLEIMNNANSKLENNSANIQSSKGITSQKNEILINIEVRSSSAKIIEDVRNDKDMFINLLTDDTCEYLY